MLARSPSARSKLSLAILVLVLGTGQQAIAAKSSPASKMRARERQAKTACLSGDYARGIAILAEMFVETNDPVHLYNQGRCYEQNVRYVEAAERFREFLRKSGDVPPDVRASVDQHLADCDAAIAKSQPRQAEAAPAPVPPSATSVTPPIPADSEAPQPENTASPPPPATPTVEYPWQHTAKWVATGAAVGFLGFGVFEHLRYYGKNRDYNKDPKCYDQGQCKDLANSADTAQTLTFVGYGAAAVATGLAIWFWATDTPRESAAQPAAISLTCTPTLTGAACGGRF